MRRQYENFVSYDGVEPDFDGVTITISEWYTFKLTLPNAEQLVADLDRAIFQAQHGTERLVALLDPAISDDEAIALLDQMNEPEEALRPAMTGDPKHRYVASDTTITCAKCGHSPRLSEPYCANTQE